VRGRCGAVQQIRRTLPEALQVCTQDCRVINERTGSGRRWNRTGKEKEKKKHVDDVALGLVGS
jgi:hypothetical protein